MLKYNYFLRKMHLLFRPGGRVVMQRRCEHSDPGLQNKHPQRWVFFLWPGIEPARFAYKQSFAIDISTR